MLASLSLMVLLGLALAALCRRVGLPRIVGLLAAGILLGPCALNLIDDSVLSISSELRQIALIIILIRAGLSLNPADLKAVGRSAVLMSCLPACCEIAGYVLLAPLLLGVQRTEAAVMGAVLAAVSPAVVVPRMIRLMDEKYGTAKRIPQMIMAGASCDDIFVIVLFSTFVNMADGQAVSWRAFAGIPVSIALGVALGTAAGLALAAFFEAAHRHGQTIRGSMKAIIVLAASFLMMAAETLAKPFVPVSGSLSRKFGKLWLAAEILLFVLVGAAVDIRYTLGAFDPALAMILAALFFRALGVLLCLIAAPLTARERLFCVIAYLPKATVQAAIGSVPLAMGLSCGGIVLSVAVLGILITAPLGALSMDASYKKLLTREDEAA